MTLLSEFLEVEVFDALVAAELGTSVFSIANLAHDLNVRAIVFNMLV